MGFSENLMGTSNTEDSIITLTVPESSSLILLGTDLVGSAARCGPVASRHSPGCLNQHTFNQPLRNTAARYSASLSRGQRHQNCS